MKFCVFHHHRGILNTVLVLLSFHLLSLCMQVQTARWPPFFKGQSFLLLEEKNKRWFTVKIADIEEIPNHQHDSELRKWKQNEYVLVYQYSAQSQHTVYVEKYNASAKMVECINSHGQKDQRQCIKIQDIIKLYRVTCTALQGLPGLGIDRKISFIIDRINI